MTVARLENIPVGDGVRPERRICGQRLLDALEAVGRMLYACTMWRSVREGRDLLADWRSDGCWDHGTLGVLYTSETWKPSNTAGSATGISIGNTRIRRRSPKPAYY